MADCTIVKRVAPGEWTIPIDDATSPVARRVRRWIAVCPACGPLTYTSRTFPENPPRVERFRTRKQAKDFLYRHNQKNHS